MKRFFLMPNDAVDDRRLNRTTLQILAVIARHRDANGVTTMRQSVIATKARCSRRTAQRGTAGLIAAGYLAVEATQRATGARDVNRYRVVYPDKRPAGWRDAADAAKVPSTRNIVNREQAELKLTRKGRASVTAGAGGMRHKSDTGACVTKNDAGVSSSVTGACVTKDDATPASFGAKPRVTINGAASSIPNSIPSSSIGAEARTNVAPSAVAVPSVPASGTATAKATNGHGSPAATPRQDGPDPITAAILEACAGDAKRTSDAWTWALAADTRLKAEGKSADDIERTIVRGVRKRFAAKGAEP